jgi:hypothetical protein
LNRDRLVHAPSPNRRPSTSWASPSSAAKLTPANSRSNELPEHQVRTLGSDAVIEAGEQMTQSTSPTAAQKPPVPPLALSQAQRERIRQAVSSGDIEVSFALKSAKGAESFEPSVGAKVPNALKLHPLPPPLIYRMQPLKRYTYIKFKHQVLIVNPMTRQIVDMFSES